LIRAPHERQPADGVIVAVLGPTEIEAIITSFCTTPAAS